MALFRQDQVRISADDGTGTLRQITGSAKRRISINGLNMERPTATGEGLEDAYGSTIDLGVTNTAPVEISGIFRDDPTNGIATVLGKQPSSTERTFRLELLNAAKTSAAHTWQFECTVGTVNITPSTGDVVTGAWTLLPQGPITVT